MKLNYRKGIYLALGTAFFSGVANFVNKFAVSTVDDPLVFTTLKNSLVALVIISVIMVSKKLSKIQSLAKKDMFSLLAIGIVGGSLPFYLFFSALSQMPAINAALIHKTLIFWVALLAVPLLGEKISLKQVGALGLIFSANLVVGGFGGFSFSMPELMVLVATFLWAVENIVAKITLKRVDPDIVVTARIGIGSLVLLAAIAFSGKVTIISSLNFNQLGLITITSLILFGYVTTWYRALRVAPVTMVATILTLATLITNTLSAIFITHSFAIEQLAQFIFTVTGVWFFVIIANKISRSTIQQTETSVSL